MIVNEYQAFHQNISMNIKHSMLSIKIYQAHNITWHFISANEYQNNLLLQLKKLLAYRWIANVAAREDSAEI